MTHSPPRIPASTLREGAVVELGGARWKVGWDRDSKRYEWAYVDEVAIPAPPIISLPVAVVHRDFSYPHVWVLYARRTT